MKDDVTTAVFKLGMLHGKRIRDVVERYSGDEHEPLVLLTLAVVLTDEERRRWARADGDLSVVQEILGSRDEVATRLRREFQDSRDMVRDLSLLTPDESAALTGYAEDLAPMLAMLVWDAIT